MIVEIAGRPAEHVKAALEKHIMILNDVKDLEVHSIKVSDPKEIEAPLEQGGPVKKTGMFTCFAEADFSAPTFSRLSETMFDFMPSSVEIVEPAKVTMEMTEATELLNNISGRMHRYDEISKVAQMKINQLSTQLQAAQQALMEKDKKPVKKKAAKKTKKKSVKKSSKKK